MDKFTPEDVAILVGAGKLRPLAKYECCEVFQCHTTYWLLANREWLDEATKTIGLF
jgi:hypothetical protein